MDLKKMAKIFYEVSLILFKLNMNLNLLVKIIKVYCMNNKKVLNCRNKH